MSKPACDATTKAGAPCKAAPIAGTTRCLAHSDAKARESVGFVARNGKQGRPARPRVADIIRQRVEAAVDRVFEPHFRALGITGWTEDGEPVVDDAAAAMEVGRSNSGAVRLTDIADLGARIAAAEKLLDRVYGRPKQAHSIEGGEDIGRGGESPVDREIRETLAEFDRRDAAGELVGEGQ